MTLLTDKPIKKRIELRKKLLQIRECRKLQKDNLYKLYIKPIDDNIVRIDNTLKGNLPINHYIKDSEKLNKYLKKLLRGG